MKRKVWTKCECGAGGFAKRRRGKDHTNCTRECRFISLRRSEANAKDIGAEVEAQSSGQEAPHEAPDTAGDSLVSQGA